MQVRPSRRAEFWSIVGRRAGHQLIVVLGIFGLIGDLAVAWAVWRWFGVSVAALVGGHLATTPILLWVAWLFVLAFDEVASERDSLRKQLDAEPRPHLVYERMRPATGVIGGRITVPGSPQTEEYVDHGAWFARVEYRNLRQAKPRTTRVDRPHVRIAYYREGSDQLFDLVRNGRIAEAIQMYNPNERDLPTKAAPEVALAEVRVGESITIDLLVRIDGAADARTWSNDGDVLGRTPFPAGLYTAEVEIEGDNMDEAVVDRFRLTVPDDDDAALGMERIIPE